LKEAVSKKISFVGMLPFIPKKKKTHHKEAHATVKILGITWAQLVCISILRFMLQSKYNLLSGAPKLRLLIASANVGETLFVSAFTLVTINSPFVFFCGALAHGQCWAMRIPLMNELVHPDEYLQFYTESAVRAYNEIVKVLQNSALAFKFGARMGLELSAGDSSCCIAAILEGCRRGGKTVSDTFSKWRRGEVLSDKESSPIKAIRRGGHIAGKIVRDAFWAIKDALLAAKMGDEPMAQIELLRANTKRKDDDNDDASTSDAEDNSSDDVEDLGSNSEDDSSDAEDLDSDIEALLHGRVSEETIKGIENNTAYII
jgi:hypothetical protein